MPSKTRHYYVPSINETVAAGKLKRLSKAYKIDAMRNWFSENYDTPDELPYDSSEGGYQWIWGGPYDAEEELQDEFGGIIPDDVIEGLASELADNSYEWSGKPNDDDYLAELIDSGTDPFLTLIGSLTEIESAAKIRASNNERKTLHKLLFANVITALETFLGDLFIKTLSKSEQYIEDFVRKTGRFQQTKIPLSEIFDRFKRIDAEVRAYVLAHNWHMLKESGLMYKRAFNIKFPETPIEIANGIRDRHDIVHRNGKTQDGVEGSWGLTEISALKDVVLTFAGDIDDQAKKLSITSLNPPPSAPDLPEKNIEF